MRTNKNSKLVTKVKQTWLCEKCNGKDVTATQYKKKDIATYKYLISKWSGEPVLEVVKPKKPRNLS